MASIVAFKTVPLVAKFAKVIVKKSNFGPAKLTVTALVALFNGVG
jgi:hypothetical protein